RPRPAHLANQSICSTGPFGIIPSLSSRSDNPEDRRKADASLHYPQRASTSNQTIPSPDRPAVHPGPGQIRETMEHSEKHDESFRHSRPAHLANQSICSTGPFEIISSLSPRAGSPEDRRKTDESLHYPQRAST
ncbi:unnamed protein product, partial [Rotaria socialis]